MIGILLTVAFLLTGFEAHGQSSTRPFHEPQLSFSMLSTLKHDVKIIGESSTEIGSLPEGSVFTIDQEIRYHDHMNIGFTFEFLWANGGGEIPEQYGVEIGPFVRGQFPVTKYLNLFARGSISVGPQLLLQRGGIFGVGYGTAGAEFYFNDWFGVSAGAGYHYVIGKETVTLGKGAFFSGHGAVWTLGLKTTYF